MSETHQIPSLGKLETVDLKEVWTSEPYSFTPWLAQPDNLQFLAETIGLPGLELIATEQQVDVFSADIVARSPDTGQVVLIENQIARTDHTHLGQVLTYAAGLEAAIIIWIARTFTEGHRAALDWLNRITDEEFAFFGVEIQALKIGESKAAPRFNVVSRPNGWSKQLKAASASAEASPQAAAHAAFWAGYESVAKQTGAPIRVAAKPVVSTNYYVRISKGGMVYLCAYRALSLKKLGVYLSVQGADAAGTFEHLQAARTEIEARFGEPLVWEAKAEGNLFRIVAGSIVPSTDEQQWPEQQSWLAERMKRLESAVLPLLADDIGPPPGPSEV